MTKHLSPRCPRCSAAAFACLVVLSPCLGRVGQAGARPEGDAGRDALLAEVAAGIEANLASIQHGVATYVQKQTRYFQTHGTRPLVFDSTPRGPFTSEQTVYFDYPRLRIDKTGNGRIEGDDLTMITERLIYDGRQQISYKVPHSTMPDGSPLIPRLHFAFIHPDAADVLHGQNHPRRQLTDSPPPQVALAEMPTYKNVTLTAARDATGQIYVVLEGRRRRTRKEFWFSPQDGYSLVREREWSLAISESEPVRTRTATFRRVVNGAYVMDHRIESVKVASGGRLVPQSDEEATLTDIDVTTAPDPELFTLDGIGLPVGAKIRDKVAGKDYRYGVPDVRETELNVPRARGPSVLRYWRFAAYIGGGLVLLLVGYAYQRRAAHRRSSPAQ